MYLGIDIASVDGNKLVDWTKAKASGVQFAIFRATYAQWSDPTWKLESDRARAAGLTVGAYLFPVMSLTAPSPEAQVAAFVKAVGPLTHKDLPPTLDVEFPGGIAKTGRTPRQLLDWVYLAIHALWKAYGSPPMIYTSARVWDGEDSDSLNADALGTPSPELLECPLWLARYAIKTRVAPIGDTAEERKYVDSLPTPPVPKAWVDATNVWLHQYQGDAVRLSGFTSTADLNRFFDLKKGDKGQRVKWLQHKLGIPTDGDFGSLTRNEVMLFQHAHRLTVDGVVGPKTFAQLCWY